MKKRIITCLMVLLCLFSLHSYGQILEEYETEKLPDNTLMADALSDGSHVYIAGYTTANDTIQGFVHKLDTLGNIIWSTLQLPNMTSQTFGFAQEILDGNDGFIYVRVSGSSNPIYKISKQTGQIIYQANFTLSNISKMHLLSNDTILLESYALYTGGLSNLRCYYFDKSTGTLLGGFYPRNYQASNPWYARQVETNHQNSLYYVIEDTLFKSSLSTPLTVDWFHVSQGNYYTKIHYDTLENVIYLMARDNILSGLHITKIDAQTGSQLWFYSSFGGPSSGAGGRLTDMKLSGNSLYLSFTNNQVTFGNHPTSNLKINKTTGSLDWVSTEHFSDISFNDFSDGAYSILPFEDKLFVVGRGEYWKTTFMALDTSTGSQLFYNTVEPSVPNLVNDYTSGRGERIVQLSSGKMMILSDVSPRITATSFYDLDIMEYAIIEPNNGQILKQNSISINQTSPSTTVFMEAFSDSMVVVARQMGRYANVQLRNQQGAILWEKNLVDGSASLLDFGQIVNDTMFILAGQVLRYENEFLSSEITPTQNNFILLVFSKSGNLIKAINHKDKTINCYKDPNSTLSHILAYDVDNNTYKIKSYTSQFSPGPEIILNNVSPIDVYDSKILTLNNDSLFYCDNDLWVHRKFNLTAGPTGPVTYPITQYKYVKRLNDNIGVAVGKSANNELGIITFDLNDGTAINTHVVNNLLDNPEKWISSESDSTIYILMSRTNNTSYIMKYHLYNKQVLWSSNLLNGNGDIIQVSDIDFNETSQYLTITGSLKTVGTSIHKIFISIFDINGNVIGRLVRDGASVGNNQGITAMSLPNQDKTWIGGSYMNNNNEQAAFIYYASKNAIQQEIAGHIFVDYNNNKIQDMNEPSVPVGSVILDNTEEIYLDSDGTFRTYTTFGWHTATLNLPNDWQLTTDSMTYNYHPTLAASTLSFGIRPVNTVRDISTSVFGQALVCNQTKRFHLRVKNTGTTFENIALKMGYEGSYESASLVPDSVQSHQIQWNLGELSPGTIELLTVDITIPSANFLGDTLVYTVDAMILDTLTQTFVDSFQYEYKDILLCAYDPNDKQVQPLREGNEVTLGQDLTYTIRFQNTGNYPAQHVIITDTLSANLDESSFRFLGASHPITEVIRKGNAIAFKFLNIYLPDSVNNEPESHGFVAFNISPLNNMTAGTLVENRAHIYFDLNEAIITNTTNSIFVEPTVSVKNVGTISNEHYKVYPNPVSDLLNIDAANSSLSPVKWQLFDVLGKQIKAGYLKDKNTSISVSDMPTGIYLLKINNTIVSKVIIQER